MKKQILALAALVALPFVASADITVTLPAGSGLDSIQYQHAPVAKITTAKSRAQMGIVRDAVAVKDNKAIIPVSTAQGGSSYQISLGDRRYVQLYALPGESIDLNVSSMDPFDYKMSGTALINSLQEVSDLQKPFFERQRALYANGEPSQADMEAFMNDYNEAMTDYVEEKMAEEGVLAALMNLPFDKMSDYFGRLPERAKASVMYPVVKQQYDRMLEMRAQEEKQQQMASGNTPAPNFTLEDINGKQVSLSDFKGKWVILDFWGSWCGWCIKGFPELKEAYAKYKDRLEVIGVDCRESKEAWLAGVKKYELPWVNVYNPEDSNLISEWGIQGFPTKAIVGPNGMIRNITTGHDPNFFVELDKLMAE